MKAFLSAIQFLTIVPLKYVILRAEGPKDLSRSAAYFPAVGLLIGLALAGTSRLLSFAGLEPLVSSVTVVVALIILTGGLHLDGLADTFDALSSHKDRDGMLKVMRDPSVGAMGAIAIAAVLMLEVSLLASINTGAKFKSLILMCVLSRWAMTMAIFFFPYARTEGKAKIFFDGKNTGIFIVSTLTAIVIAFAVSGLPGLAIFAAAGVFAYLVNVFIKKRIGGITGDTIGAVNELTEIAVLFGAVILLK